MKVMPNMNQIKHSLYKNVHYQIHIAHEFASI